MIHIPIKENLLNNLLILIFFSLFGIYIGINAAHENYFNLGLLLACFLVLIVIWSTRLTLAALLLHGFFATQLVEFGVHMIFIYLWDFMIILLFVKSLIYLSIKNKVPKLIGFLPISGLLCTLISSHFLNNTTLPQALLFARYFIIGYLLFISVLNLKLADHEIHYLVNLTILVFIIQIPASCIKLLIYGQGERVVGTFGFSPGEVGTILPLIAIAFLLSIYLYHPSKRLICLILTVGYISFSLMANKRAFIFFLPILFLIIYLFYNARKAAKMKFGILAVLIFIIACYSIPRLVPTFNPDQKIGGKFDIKYIYEFTKRYTLLKDPMGNSQGRLATTIRSIKVLNGYGLIGLLTGDGPGKLINSAIIDSSINRSKFNYGIEDGITGFVWISLQIGILGCLFYILFILTILRSIKEAYKSAPTLFEKALGLGLLATGILFILDILVYSKFFASSRTMLTVFFLLSAILLKNTKKYSPQLS